MKFSDQDERHHLQQRRQQQHQQPMKKHTLADLPPELLDHIVASLPTARCLSHLQQTSRSLRDHVELSGWSVFARHRFPTSAPQHSNSWKQTVRSLTTRSRAWDRRAIIARFIEPSGSIYTYPGAKVTAKWKRPTGQTVGFTPRIDACSLEDGTSAHEPATLLAYSAGAQIVLRRQAGVRRSGISGASDVRWMTYKPLSAVEGRDDVTTLHILRNQDLTSKEDKFHLIIGTANGDLQHISIPHGQGERKVHTYFITQGRGLQSSSITTNNDGETLLAASLGHTHLALYKVDAEQAKSAPVSEIDTNPANADNHDTSLNTSRVWSTQFLPQNRLAIGFGPSVEPIRIYDLSPSGLSPTPIRRFELQDPVYAFSAVDTQGRRASRRVVKTSVYPIVPVPGRGDLFYSGAYDGLIRLHDMRSPRATELIIQDGYDDSAIYSLLLRGEETLIAGTSRHSHLKVFDARMNARAYFYLDATTNGTKERPSDDFSLYLSTRTSWHNSNRWRTDGSIYSLAATSASSPYIYAGVQNGVIEVASTEILHRHPDPLYFEPWPGPHDRVPEWNGWSSKSVLNVARYEARKMNGQKSLWDTWQTRHSSVGDSYLDARWKGVKAIDLD